MGFSSERPNSLRFEILNPVRDSIFVDGLHGTDRTPSGVLYPHWLYNTFRSAEIIIEMDLNLIEIPIWNP